MNDGGGEREAKAVRRGRKGEGWSRRYRNSRSWWDMGEEKVLALSAVVMEKKGLMWDQVVVKPTKKIN